MPVKFTIKYDERELTRIKAKIAGISKGDWMSRALLESMEYMIYSTKKGIDKGIDIDGKPFHELSREYVKRPLKKGGRGGSEAPILVRPAGSEYTDRKFKSMGAYRRAKKNKFGYPGQLYTSLMVGDVKTNLFGGKSIITKPGDALMQELGAIHQFPKATSHMPRRAWLGFRDGDSKRVKSIFSKHLNIVMGAK